MKAFEFHSWDISPREARTLQKMLSAEVIAEDQLEEIRLIAGADVGFDKVSGRLRAAVAVLSFPALEVIERVVIERPAGFPYVPGLLSFREVPALLEAFAKLKAEPGLVLCDGQGIAHPRRFGLACHLGLLLDVPAIGAAKSRLTGEHAEPDPEKGAWAPLMDGVEVIGAALRTRAECKPIYVSVGHRVCLETAIKYVLACAPRYRLPETTRQADRLSKGG